MISVLLPTRGRVDRLHTMLSTLYATVFDPDNVEVIARCDTDDQPTVTYLRSLGKIKMVVRERIGYAQNARMVNECAQQAAGELLLVANDDLVFQTTNWDTKLERAAEKYPDGIFNLGVDTVLNNENYCFPCTSRRVVNILGFFFDERLLYPDIWLRDVMRPFGRAVRVPEVVIRHAWTGMTEDQQRAIAVTQQSTYPRLYDQCVIEAQDKIRQAIYQDEEKRA